MSDLFYIENNGTIIIGNKVSGAWIKIGRDRYQEAIKSGELDKFITKYLENRQSKKKQSVNSFYLLVTDRCNMNCKFCSINASDTKINENEFSYKMLQNQIETIKIINPKKVVISGGEPFVREDIFEIIKLLSQTVGREKLMIETNGLLLTETTIDKIAPYVSTLEFSIENIIENAKLQNKFQRILNKLYEENISTNLSFVVSSLNMCMLEKALEFSAKNNSSFIIRFLAPIGRAEKMDKAAFLTISQINSIIIRIITYIVDNNLEGTKIANSILPFFSIKTACAAGTGRTISMFPDGNLYMCSNLHNDRYKIGNIFEQDLDEIFMHWKDKLEDFNLQKEMMADFDEKCMNCDFRYFCTGICVAKKIQCKDKFDEYLLTECLLRKELIKYYLFIISKDDDKKTKLQKLKVYLQDINNSSRGE